MEDSYNALAKGATQLLVPIKEQEPVECLVAANLYHHDLPESYL